MFMSKTEWLSAAPMSATNSKADTPLFPFLVRLDSRRRFIRARKRLIFFAL